MNPLIYDVYKPVAEYCEARDIQVTAFGSVLAGHGDLLAQADAIADKHHKTTAQVFLRWGIQRRYQVIPKTSHTQWMDENRQIFDFALSDEEMRDLEALNGSIYGDW